MMKDNKVLTVSYGTHSCTLEGFANALHAVEPILEYFRDLTQDAHSIDVGLPRPDAVVMAQIAARATSLAVEPSQQAGRIVLTAIDDPLIPPPAAAAEPTMVKLMGDALTAAIGQKKPETPEPAKTLPSDHAPAEDGTIVQDAPQSAAAFFANSTPIVYLDEEDMGTPLAAAKAIPGGPAQNLAQTAPTTADDDSVAAKLRRIHDVLSQEDAASSGAENAQAAAASPLAKANPSPEQNTMLTHAAEKITAALVTDDQVARLAEEVFEAEEENLRDTLSAMAQNTDPSRSDVPEENESKNVFDNGDDSQNSQRETLRLRPDWAEGTASLRKAPETTEPTQETADRPETAPTRLRRRASDATGVDDTATQQPEALYCSPGFDQNMGEDLSRLMAKADDQMEDPDGTSRRNAFSHLRAAVAARFADKSMRDGSTNATEANVYRDDLAEAVKPRRPIATTNRTTRRPNARSAPLKLVPEQRVDIDAVIARKATSSQHAAMLRGANPTTKSLSGFADFAQDKGADKLPDVLEAAAAYLSLIEANAQFSSTEVITHARQAKCPPFSREEGLRAFGQLLRDGKINKLKEGRFTVSDTNCFVPG